MISTDSRTGRECLTPLDHDRVLVVVNGSGNRSGGREFPLLALFGNEYAFGVGFLVLRVVGIFLGEFFLLL